MDAIVTNAAGLRLAPEGRGPRPAGPGHLRDARSQGRAAERHPLPLRVAFQDSCHLAHAQRIRSEPRELLRSIPGVELLEPAEQEICCGSAGIYNLVQPEAARELGERKAANVLATEPDVYASANPGCLLQVTAALRRAGTAAAGGAPRRAARRVAARRAPYPLARRLEVALVERVAVRGRDRRADDGADRDQHDARAG